MDYFAIPAVSYSRLKVLHDDPLDYWGAFICDPPRVTFDESKALDRGHIAHAALLEPHRVHELYEVYPEGMLSGKNQAISSKEAKAWRDARRAAGVIPIKQDDLDEVMRMVDGLLASEYRSWFEGEALREQVVTWTERVDGFEVECKAKLDLIIDDDVPDIIDLKFLSDPSDVGFRNAIKSYLYPLQRAQYVRAAKELLGCDDVRMTFLAVKDHPARTRIAPHSIEGEEAAYGELLRQHLMRDLVRRMAADDWHADWEKKVNRLSLSPWDMKLPELERIG